MDVAAPDATPPPGAAAPSAAGDANDPVSPEANSAATADGGAAEDAGACSTSPLWQGQGRRPQWALAGAYDIALRNIACDIALQYRIRYRMR